MQLGVQMVEGVLIVHGLLAVGAEDGGGFGMVLAVESGRQAELADEVLRVRPGEGGVQYAAAVRHGVFQRTVVVVDVTADAVPGDGALHIQRLSADCRETAHVAADGAAAEIDGEADLPVLLRIGRASCRERV